jgi:hypothetical protein
MPGVWSEYPELLEKYRIIHCTPLPTLRLLGERLGFPNEDDDESTRLCAELGWVRIAQIGTVRVRSGQTGPKEGRKSP